MTSERAQQASPEMWDLGEIWGHEVDKNGKVTYKVKWKVSEESTLKTAETSVFGVNQEWVEYNFANDLWKKEGAMRKFRQ